MRQRARSIQPKFPGQGSKISWGRMDRDFDRSRSSPLSTFLKMADVLMLLPELMEDDVNVINDIIEDDDDIVVFSAASCFMRRNLTRIAGYFEQTVPRYLPDEFKHHFRMTKETFEILSGEILRTGHIPLGNPSGRPVIQPQKQILTFLWGMANQEPARAIADRFDITRSSYNRVFRRVVMAAVGLSNEYIRWPTGEYHRSISKLLPTRSLAHRY